jgi:hypothetical protein
MIFNTNSYIKFLKFIKKFPVVPLKEWCGNNAIILRHDVEIDTKAALRLAKLEDKYKIHSTFFFLVSSYAYNIMTKENQKILHSLKNMGFEIGLHFDPSIYKTTSQKLLETYLRIETNILESITKIPIFSISLHQPSLHKQYILFNKYLNAYDKKIFSSEKYLSDSRMKLPKNIFEFVKRVKKHPIQILIHPEHINFKETNYLDIAYRRIKYFISEIDADLQLNSTYKGLLKSNKTSLNRHVANKILQVS